MRLINRIRAFLKINHRPVVMDLKSAEIQEDYAYLHPKDSTQHSYKVHAEDIEIRLCDGRTLTDSDILPVEKKNQTEKPVEVSSVEKEEPKKEKQIRMWKGSEESQLQMKWIDLKKRGVSTL